MSSNRITKALNLDSDDENLSFSSDMDFEDSPNDSNEDSSVNLLDESFDLNESQSDTEEDDGLDLLIESDESVFFPEIGRKNK